MATKLERKVLLGVSSLFSGFGFFTSGFLIYKGLYIASLIPFLIGILSSYSMYNDLQMLKRGE